MKMKLVIVDLELSKRAKRVAAVVLVPVVVVVGGALAYAGVPHTWANGDTLNATDLNADFANLDQRITTLAANALAGGSVNALVKWSGATSVSNSIITDTGAAVGIGIATPVQTFDTFTGRIRTNGIQYNDQGTNYGKITVAQGVPGVDAVTVPWPVTDVTANYGMSFTWNASGPRLGDTVGCAQGANPSYTIDNSGDTSWPGQYTVTFTNCNPNGQAGMGPGSCITGTWEGWELRLFQAAGAAVAGSSHGFVHFILAYENNTWRVESMSGMVGTTTFECH